MNRLYIGNLPFAVNEDDLQTMFEATGRVTHVTIPTDRETGRKRGFAFIEMDSQEAADKAIVQWHNRNLDGRNIVVALAKPKAA